MMTGSGVENDKKVEVRITLRLGPNEYHCLRETRLPGPAFQMRDAYNSRRVILRWVLRIAVISGFHLEALHW